MNEELLTEEEKRECMRKAKRRSIAIVRWLCAFVILALISLSWYGAEMLLYQYCQPSIVKAFVAVCIAMGLSGRIQKELIIDANKKEFFEGFAKGLIKKYGDKSGDGRDAGSSGN